MEDHLRFCPAFRQTLSRHLLVSSIVAFIVLASHSTAAYAWLSSSLHVPYLTEQANLIVKGRVLAVEKQADGSFQARVQVDSVLKGTWPAGEVTFPFPASGPLGPMYDNVTPNDYALFFLAGTRKPVNPQHIRVRIKEGNTANATAGTDAVKLVHDELLFTALAFLQARQVAAEPEKPDAMVLTAIEQLAYFPPDEPTANLMKELMVDDNPAVRGLAIAASLRFSPLPAIKPAVAFLASRPKEEISSVERIRGYLRGYQGGISAVLTSLEYVSDSAVLEDIGKLLDDPDLSTRKAAIGSLRKMVGRTSREAWSSVYAPGIPDEASMVKRNAKILPFLIHGLDDTDVANRQQAVWALTEATFKRDWYPAYSIDSKDYRQLDEKIALDRWKEWWKLQQAAMPDAPQNADHQAP